MASAAGSQVPAGASPPRVSIRWMKSTWESTPSPRLASASSNSQGIAVGSGCTLFGRAEPATLLARAQKAWADAAGSGLAAFAEPVSERDGVLAEVDYVQRIETQGGVAPTGACDPAADRTVAVPYRARYVFYAD